MTKNCSSIMDKALCMCDRKICPKIFPKRVRQVVVDQNWEDLPLCISGLYAPILAYQEQIVLVHLQSLSWWANHTWAFSEAQLTGSWLTTCPFISFQLPQAQMQTPTFKHILRLCDLSWATCECINQCLDYTHPYIQGSDHVDNMLYFWNKWMQENKTS